MNLFSQLYWIRGFGATRRFHGIRMLHDETVAHHSSNVASIIIQAWKTPSANLLKAAILHDLPEGITGDIPAPVKWACLGTENLNALETSIYEFFHIKYPDLYTEEIQMLKAADFIDAVFTCLLERVNGNREIHWVYQNYVDYEKKSQLLDPFINLKSLWLEIQAVYLGVGTTNDSSILLLAEQVNFWSDKRESNTQ